MTMDVGTFDQLVDNDSLRESSVEEASTIESSGPETSDSLQGEPTLTVSRNVLLAVAIYLTCVGLCSTFGNSMFIMVLRRRLKVLSDGQTLLLMNMAVCDLSIFLTGYPYTTISAYVGRWIWGDTVCQISAFLCFTLNEVQMNTLVVIALFRYVTVCRPEMSHFLTNDLALRCLLVVWIYCLAWTTPPLFGWSRYIQEPFSVSCSTDWYDRSPSGIAYSLCLIVFCYLVQVISLSICYFKILKKSRQLQLRLPQTDPKLSMQQDEDYSQVDGIKCCNYVCVCESNFRNGVEKHVLMMNLLMVLSFFFFWTPYAVISLVSIFKTDLKAFWYIFPTIFAKTSCMMNPIIYGLSHKILRRELVRFLRSCCCNRHAAMLRELEEARRRAAEGTHDKEGIYVGKVKVGLCACNGCVIGRRETLHAQMAVLARLQKNPATLPPNENGENAKNKEVNTCAITLVSDGPMTTGPSNGLADSNKRRSNQDEDDVVELIMNPKIWPPSSNGPQQQKQQQESSFSSNLKNSTVGPKNNSSQKLTTTFEKNSDQKSVEMSVTARIGKKIGKNTTTTTTTSVVSDSSSPSDKNDDGQINKNPQELTVIETTTNSSITNTFS